MSETPIDISFLLSTGSYQTSRAKAKKNSPPSYSPDTPKFSHEHYSYASSEPIDTDSDRSMTLSTSDLGAYSPAKAANSSPPKPVTVEDEQVSLARECDVPPHELVAEAVHARGEVDQVPILIDLLLYTKNPERAFVLVSPTEEGPEGDPGSGSREPRDDQDLEVRAAVRTGSTVSTASNASTASTSSTASNSTIKSASSASPPTATSTLPKRQSWGGGKPSVTFQEEARAVGRSESHTALSSYAESERKAGPKPALSPLKTDDETLHDHRHYCHHHHSRSLSSRSRSKTESWRRPPVVDDILDTKPGIKMNRQVGSLSAHESRHSPSSSLSSSSSSCSHHTNNEDHHKLPFSASSDARFPPRSSFDIKSALRASLDKMIPLSRSPKDALSPSSFARDLHDSFSASPRSHDRLGERKSPSSSSLSTQNCASRPVSVSRSRDIESKEDVRTRPRSISRARLVPDFDPLPSPKNQAPLEYPRLLSKSATFGPSRSQSRLGLDELDKGEDADEEGVVVPKEEEEDVVVREEEKDSGNEKDSALFRKYGKISSIPDISIISPSQNSSSAPPPSAVNVSRFSRSRALEARNKSSSPITLPRSRSPRPEVPTEGGAGAGAFDNFDFLPPNKRSVGSLRTFLEECGREGTPALPECLRTEFVSGKTDWLTLYGCDNFDICPECHDAVFASSPYNAEFQHAPWVTADKKYFCDFGAMPWYRFAYLFTLKRKHQDLHLMKDIASITSDGRADFCPGDRRVYGTWYSFRNPDTGKTITGFNVCYQCSRAIGILLPSLKGSFVAVNKSSEPMRNTCSMHFKPSRRRFFAYWGILEEAAETRDPVEAQEFLAEELEYLSRATECPQERVVANERWYYPHSLPHLTVCGDCFDEVVRAKIDRGVPLARAFYSRPQRLAAASCQLNSNRMREMFDKACARNDWKQLQDQVSYNRRQLEKETAASEAGRPASRGLERGPSVSLKNKIPSRSRLASTTP